MEEITLYSTRCPKCKAVEILLHKKDVDFTLIEDSEKVVQVGEEHGIISAPILKVGNEFLDFSKAVKYINTLRR